METHAIFTVRQQRALAQLRQGDIPSAPALTSRILESPPWFYRLAPWMLPFALLLTTGLLALPFVQIRENWGEILVFQGNHSVELNTDQSLTLELPPIGGLLVLQGPADLRVEHARRRLLTGRREGKFYLSYGELYFKSSAEIPKEILIQTPLLTARIHGTEFLIGHHPNGGSRLAIIEGKVEVRPNGSLTGWKAVSSGTLFSVSPDRAIRQEGFQEWKPLDGGVLNLTLPGNGVSETIPRYVDDRQPPVNLKQLLWHEEE